MILRRKCTTPYRKMGQNLTVKFDLEVFYQLQKLKRTYIYMYNEIDVEIYEKKSMHNNFL